MRRSTETVILALGIAISSIPFGVRVAEAKCDPSDACVAVCPAGTLTKGSCSSVTPGSTLVCCTAPESTACAGSCTRGTACTGLDTPIAGQTCPSVGGEAYTCCATRSAAPASATSTPFVNALCFTQDQCTAPEYGGSVDRFVPGQGCPQGQGKCLAPEPEITLSNPIMGFKTVQGFRGYVFLGFQYLLNIVILAAALMFIWAGFRYIFGSTIGGIQRSKEIMVNATVGLLLTFGAVLLLRTLNPATTTFEALKIYLINKQEISLLNRCMDIPTKKFADAGRPVGAIPFSADPKMFTISGPSTACGKNYYVQGTSGQTCAGFACKNANELCVSCAGGVSAKECAGKSSQDMSCVTMAFGGNVAWANDTYPKKMFLIPVCNWAQPADVSKWSVGSVRDNTLMEMLPATFWIKPTGSSGNATYSFPVTMSDLKEWESACASKGKINGVVIGVVYNDNCSVVQAALKASKALNAQGIPETLGTAVEGAGCLISPDDVLIVSKNDCKGANLGNKAPAAAKYFSGYVTAWQAHELVLMSSAMYCGWRVQPNVGWLGDNAYTHRFDWAGDGPQNPYWSFQDLSKAMNGTQAIQCDFELNSINAPRNPSKAIMSSCLEGQDWNSEKKVPQPIGIGT